MMLKRNRQDGFFIAALLLCVLIILLSCTKENNAGCVGMNIVLSSTPSDSCLVKGTITINAPAGPGYEYKTGNAAFSSAALISGLLPGEHTVLVRSAGGCTDSAKIVVAATVTGPLFTSAKNVLTTYCFPCHTGSNPQAGHNWAEHCDILVEWERIQARAINGNPAPMPPSGLIPQSERDKIAAWINAGHRLEN